MRAARSILNLLAIQALFNVGGRAVSRELSSWPCPAHIQDQKIEAAIAKRIIRKAKRLHWAQQMNIGGHSCMSS